MAIWNFFATYILRQAPYMIGFITLIGYALMKKKWYDILGGTLKAIIGMLILNVGSGGLVSNFRPILAGLKDRFNLTACVIDPYYGQKPSSSTSCLSASTRSPSAAPCSPPATCRCSRPRPPTG